MSDAVGDITEMTHGLFANDTRMLSRLRLLVDGAQPLLLTSKAVEYFAAAHYARNAPTEQSPRRHGVDLARALHRPTG